LGSTLVSSSSVFIAAPQAANGAVVGAQDRAHPGQLEFKMFKNFNI